MNISTNIESYYNISDDKLIETIFKALEKIDYLDFDSWSDKIVFPDDEFKQFILTTIYLGGILTNAWPEKTPPNNFRKRILRAFLKIKGITIIEA